MYSSEYQKEWKLSKIIEGLNQIDKDHYLTELQVSSNFSLGIWRLILARTEMFQSLNLIRKQILQACNFLL